MCVEQHEELTTCRVVDLVRLGGIDKDTGIKCVHNLPPHRREHVGAILAGWGKLVRTHM